MPLFWMTDKIIAGKYKVKKPVPLEAEFESCEGWWLEIFGYDWEGDDEMIKTIERVLKGEKIIGIDGKNSWEKEDEYFLKNIMEYLEIIKEYIFDNIHCTDDGGDYVRYTVSGIVSEKLGREVKG